MSGRVGYSLLLADTGRGFRGLLSADKSITLVHPGISKGFPFLKTETKKVSEILKVLFSYSEAVHRQFP